MKEMKAQKVKFALPVLCLALALMCLFSSGAFASAQTLYSCDFETESMMDDWTIEDRDGDGREWYIYDQGPESSYPYGKSLLSWSYSGVDKEILYPNNAAYTPEIAIPAKAGEIYLDYTVFVLHPDYPYEHYSVYVEDVDTKALGKLCEETLSPSEDYKTPESKHFDLSPWAGKTVRIVFIHHDVSNQLAISIDNVHVYCEPESVNNVSLRVEKPLIGKVPANTASIADGSKGYTIANVFWEPYDSAFKANTAYGVVLTLEAQKGYVFTNDVAPVINGHPARIITKSAEELKITWTFRKLVEPPPSMFFNDVKTADWFYHDVEFVYYNLLMYGTGNQLFSPDESTTRGMIVAVLYRLKDEPAVSGSCPFGDVAPGSYYEKAITWAAKEHIVSGYEDGTYKPDKAISRQELASIFCRFAQAEGLYDEEDSVMLAGFKDNDKIGSWALNAVSWTAGVGLVKGSLEADGLYFNPENKAKRCEFAAMMNRLCTNFNY